MITRQIPRGPARARDHEDPAGLSASRLWLGEGQVWVVVAPPDEDLVDFLRAGREEGAAREWRACRAVLRDGGLLIGPVDDEEALDLAGPTLWD